MPFAADAAGGMNTFVPLVLFICAGLSVWLVTLLRRRATARGARIFTALMLAVALWSVTSALHSLAGTIEQKLLWAKVQYISVASVPVLWLLFAAEYGGPRLQRIEHLLLWPVPIATMLLAATNEWHQAIWTSVRMEANGVTVYEHGWWFWIDALFNYALVCGGSIMLARAAQRSAPVFRAQIFALVGAAAVPLLANVVYLSGASVPGLDPTPLAFTASGLLFVWSVYRNHLFDLVPVARGMVVDSLTDAMIVLDPARRILDVNAAARRLAGGVDDLIGRQVDDVLPQLARLPLEATDSAPPVLFVTARGGSFRYDARVTPVGTDRGGEAAWVVLLRDVTDQWRAAHERDALQARMQEQQRRESLSVLAGGLAHDFNNLLAGIVGNADLLALQVPPKSEMRNNVTAILLGAQRAADLVSKMLAYAGERHGSTARVDLDVLTRELLDLLRAAAARHCTIEYQGSPACLDADPTQIRQVAMNLIINAAESVEEGSGVVVVTTGTGRLTPRQLGEMTFGQDSGPGDYVYLEVVDNGHGMDPQMLRRIFMPFFTTKTAGHGLGLAAVQGIVLGHRGALSVDSEPGRGSRFSVWFPAADGTNVEPPVVRSVRLQPEPAASLATASTPSARSKS
jgi:PAS domain S-box-containing protein